MNRYLIIGRSRSGSTLTHLILMGHPNVSALNDELKPAPLFTQGFQTFTFGNDSEREKTHGLSALFDALTQISANQETLAAGAKTVCNSAHIAGQVVSRLQQELADLKIIHIVRDDLAALYGSAHKGKTSGVMHSWSKGNKDVEPMPIPKHRFINFVVDSLAGTNVFRQLKESHSYLELSYEDYLSDPESIERRLFDYVGVPHVSVDWLAAEKVMPPPSDYISNYDQAREWNQTIAEQMASQSMSAGTQWSVNLGKAHEKFARMLK